MLGFDPIPRVLADGNDSVREDVVLRVVDPA